MDPNPVFPERMDPDPGPVNIKTDPQTLIISRKTLLYSRNAHEYAHDVFLLLDPIVASVIV